MGEIIFCTCNPYKSIRLTKTGFAYFQKRAQRPAACGMPVCIIDLFDVINAQDCERNSRLKAGDSLKLDISHLHEAPLVLAPGQEICTGVEFQRFFKNIFLRNFPPLSNGETGAIPSGPNKGVEFHWWGGHLLGRVDFDLNIFPLYPGNISSNDCPKISKESFGKDRSMVCPLIPGSLDWCGFGSLGFDARGRV